MSTEITTVYGTQKTLASSLGSCANNAVVAATTANYSTATDGGSFPDALFVAALTFATAPVEGTVVALYAKLLGIDGANNGPTPDGIIGTYIGSFVVNAVTTIQYMQLLARDVPDSATYYLFNNGTGQSISAGGTLKVTPRSYKPAP